MIEVHNSDGPNAPMRPPRPNTLSIQKSFGGKPRNEYLKDEYSDPVDIF
jgi:hypothetical protein